MSVKHYNTIKQFIQLKKPWLASLVLHHSKNIVTNFLTFTSTVEEYRDDFGFNFCVHVSLIEKSFIEKTHKC